MAAQLLPYGSRGRMSRIAHHQRVAGLGARAPSIGPVMMCTPGPRSASAMPSQIAADAVVHQQVGRVAGVVGDRLDLDDVAAVDRRARRLVAVEVSPVAGARAWRRACVHSGGIDRGGAFGQFEVGLDDATVRSADELCVSVGQTGGDWRYDEFVAPPPRPTKLARLLDTTPAGHTRGVITEGARVATAVGLWVAVDWRRRYRVLVSLTLLAGLSFALVAVAFAGSRRTISSFDRLVTATRGDDHGVVIDSPGSSPTGDDAYDTATVDRIRHLPEVGSVGAMTMYVATLAGSDNDVAFNVPEDTVVGYDVERLRVLRGRTWHPTRRMRSRSTKPRSHSPAWTSGTC